MSRKFGEHLIYSKVIQENGIITFKDWDKSLPNANAQVIPVRLFIILKIWAICKI